MDKMPIELKKYLSRLTRRSILAAGFQLLIVCAVIAAILIGIWRKSAAAGGLTAAAALIPVAGLLVLWQAEKREAERAKEPWRVVVQVCSTAQIAQRLLSKEVREDVWVSFLSSRGIQIRNLLQGAECFDAAEMRGERKRANARINRTWNIPAERSLLELQSQARVNCVVCREGSAELEHWVQNGAARLLSRNEAIINLAFVLEERTLLLPRIGATPDVSEVRRLRAVFELYCSLFVQEGPETRQM